MSGNKVALVVVLVIVSVVLLLVAVAAIRERAPQETANEESVAETETMDDITIPVWGVAIPVLELLQATSLALHTDGGCVLVGSCYHDDIFNFYIARLDSAGGIVWQRACGGTRRDSIEGAISQTPDSGYIFAGYTNSFAEGIDSDGWITKTDDEGEVQWSRLYGHPKGTEKLTTVKALAGGGFITAGYTEKTRITPEEISGSCVLMKPGKSFGKKPTVAGQGAATRGTLSLLETTDS
jgi:hypothetical protein